MNYTFTTEDRTQAEYLINASKIVSGIIDFKEKMFRRESLMTPDDILNELGESMDNYCVGFSQEFWTNA